VENNKPLRESLKTMSAREIGEGPKTLVDVLASVAFTVAHLRNKYTTEAASPSVKPRSLGNCF
jgi:hypothetical protein